MRKAILLCLLCLNAYLLLAARPEAPRVTNPADELAFYPRLYIEGYNPLIHNRIELYKIDKGLNIYRTLPYYIPAFAPEYKERIDFPNSKVILSVKSGDYKITPDVPISFDAYFNNLQKKAFQKSMVSNIKNQTQTTQVATSGLLGELVLEIPAMAIPKAVQKVLGTSAPKLNLDGTQKLTLQASSTKRKQVPIYETGGNSTFDLKMQQETNLRLSGTIGDKISMNLKYNSKQDEQIFDANNVNIKYTGDEDEIIKSIEGGNITLSLSGSRYISYSTSSQGLFGITSKFKYGDLELNVIASKEESQKNTQNFVGKSQADSSVVSSWKYAPRTMYYLHNPYELLQLRNLTSDPEGWRGNAIATLEDGTWLVNTQYLPDDGSVELFLDDGVGSNNFGLPVGDSIYYSIDSAYDPYVPYYEQLTEGTDFVTDYSAGIVKILRNVDRLTTIAARYTRNGNIVPTPVAGQDPEIIHPLILRRRNQAYEAYDETDTSNTNSWHYQMRNVYDMNRTNIKSEGFNLQVYTVNVDLTRNYNLPDSLVASGLLTYNDYLRLDSNRDGLINGDDTTVNLTTGLVRMPFIEPFKPLGDEIIYQYENENEYTYNDQTSLFIAIKGKIGRDAIELAQGGILKGSVRVRVNGIDQRENVDYLVDYDFGRITFLSAAGKDPDARIEIDFEYRSVFEVAQKNLAGIRADWKLTDYAKLGGTLIYRSETVADKRPRIGNENIEMWMGNVDGELTFKPGFITRWLDAMPLINTTTPSQVSLSGELAFTLPNIYGNPDGKKKEAYLDDMESIVDSYPLGVTFSTWVQGSQPFGTAFAKGRINWYNPKNIKRPELEDPNTLTDKEKTETVTVLALKAKPNNLYTPGGTYVQSWAGVMKYLGNELDFSQKKYIEVQLMVDPITGVSNPNVNLHIDLGDISEDYYTEFGGYGVLNTEDINSDGVLITEEDVGLDGLAFGSPGHDPNDVAGPDIDPDTQDYPKINGTEGNRMLDTEDLNGNGVLARLNRYFSYSFSLSDAESPLIVDSLKAWRRYRIPLNDAQYYQIVNNSGTTVQPTLKKISYARIWLDTEHEVRVKIADISIVGNKWQDFMIRDFPNDTPISSTVLNAQNTSYLSGIINNQKNSSHYTPPEGTTYTEDKRESSESSLTLSLNNLQQGQQCLLRQRMFDSYSLLSYDKLRFWVYPEAPENVNSLHRPDHLDIIFRLGADSLHYYQVRQRVRVMDYETQMTQSHWRELEYNLQEMISLKQDNQDATEATEIAIADSLWFSFKGSPTLTNIRDIVLGVYVADDYVDPEANTEFTGTLYFNDIRVADPYEDIGVASRLSFSSVVADFSTLNVDYEEKSENFNPVIQRGRQNSFTRTQSLNITNKYFLNKFFPNSWALDIPILLTRNYTLGIPRFRASSDLLRENIQDPVQKEREKNEKLAYSADFGFSMKTPPKSKILQYTIYRASVSGRLESSYNYTPTMIDTLLSYRGTANYNLNIPADKSSFKLFKNYRFGFFPSTFTNSATFSANEPKSFDWAKRADSLGTYIWDWYERSQTSDTRDIRTDNNISWTILSDLTATARFNTRRDLKQKSYVYDVNIGKMNEFVQDLGLNFNPNYLPRVFNITSSATARYTDSQRKYFQNVEGTQVEVFQRDGNSNRGLRMNATLQNSTLLTAWAAKLRSRNPKAEDKPKDGIKPEDKTDDGELKMPEPMTEEQKKEEQIKRDEEQKNQDIKRDEELKEETLKREEEERLRKEKEMLDNMPLEGDDIKITETNPEDKKDNPEAEVQIPETDKEPTTPADSVAVPKPKAPPKPIFPELIGAISRIKNITASYQNAYTMNYARKRDPFPFAFQLGLPHSVPTDSLEAVSDDNTITIGSGIILSRKLDSVINYSYTNNRRYASASNQTVGFTFPDITLSLMDFESWIKMGKYLSGTRLNSGFQYTVRQNGDIDWVKPDQESRTTALNPLIGFTGNILTVVTTNLSYSVSRTENIQQMDTYQILKTLDAQSMNGNVSYSFRAGRGFTIPFSKKKIHIKNEMTSTLGITFEKNYDVTKGKDSSQVDRHTTRLAITPQASYQFDQNIRGGLTSSYEISSDKKRDDGSSIFSLGVWVEVNL